MWKNHTFAAMMLSFVRFGAILPHLAGTVDVARAEHADLSRPAPREPLNAHHVCNDVGQVGQRSIYYRVIKRSVSRAVVFPRLRPATIASA